jgi:hypothetical protein
LLIDASTRNSIAASPIPKFFDNIAETELLITIWRADVDPDSHASVNAFISTLTSQDQQCINGIMNEDSATINADLAQECLQALNRKSIENQIATTKARMGGLDLQPSELESLGKQLLDLRGQLNER